MQYNRPSNPLNINALAHLSRAAVTAFKARDRGTLVNIGSVLGLHTLPISSIYSGTKAFVVAFTRGLQEEVAGTAVKVQLVLPAATATDIWELSGVPVSAHFFWISARARRAGGDSGS